MDHTVSLSHLVGGMCPSCSITSRTGAAMFRSSMGGAGVTGEEHESRPCVDCHAFEFMQRALQDLKKTAYNLDTRTETLLLRAEKRGLCDCFRAIH
ncbi:NELL2-interacting cell ontogeny regulator 1-like isoform 3-T4 [Cyanocitta cristata]